MRDATAQYIIRLLISPLPARFLDGLEQSLLALRPPLAAVAGEVGIAEFSTARSDLYREILVGNAGTGPIGRARRH